MVAITHADVHPNGQQQASSLSQLIQFLKPLTYIGLGLAFGLVIIGGKNEEKMLRGSSYSSVHKKNMADTPSIHIDHIDINFPADPNNLGSQQNNEFMKTVSVGSPMMEGTGANVDVPVDVNVYPPPMAEVAPDQMEAASLEQMGNTIPHPEQQQWTASTMGTAPKQKQEDANGYPQVNNQISAPIQDTNGHPPVPMEAAPIPNTNQVQDTFGNPQTSDQIPMEAIAAKLQTMLAQLQQQQQHQDKSKGYVPMHQDWAASIMQQDTNAIPQVAGAAQDTSQIQETPMMQDADGNPQNSTEAESDPSSLETEN